MLGCLGGWGLGSLRNFEGEGTGGVEGYGITGEGGREVVMRMVEWADSVRSW